MKRKCEKTQRYRSRIILDDIGVDFIHQPAKHKTEINVRILSGRLRDTKHYEIIFNPPMSKQDATLARLKMIYMPSKQSNCNIVVIPNSKKQIPTVINELNYITFETHTIQINPKTGKVVLLYLSIRNIQLDGSEGAFSIFSPIFSLQHDRYTSLPFFPPDPDIQISNVDSSKVPQSIPQTFKLKGSVVGSNISELLGYFVPKPGTKKAQSYQLGKRDPFTGWKAANARFGNVGEENATISLLEHYKHMKIYECGYYGGDWGASPDCIIDDPNVDYPKEFDLESVQNKNIGVCEFKSSRSNCDFFGYYFPQCIWEMIHAETGWGSIVRYCEKKQLDKNTRTWSVRKECREIRIFRHLPTEKLLKDLVQKSIEARKKGKDAFLKLVYTKPYVDIRAKFDQFADSANKTFTNIPVANEYIQEMLQSRNLLISCQDDFIPSLHPAIDRIEDRQSEIFRLYQEPKKKKHAELLEAIGDQVKDYMELLNSTL